MRSFLKPKGAYPYILFTCLYVGIVYFLSLATQLDSLKFLIHLPPSAILSFFVSLPYIIFLNTDSVTFALFIINSTLASMYAFLLIRLFTRDRSIRLGLGLSGSLASMLSIGCAACGSLLTPLLALTSVGFPLALVGSLNILLGISASVLLATGIVLLLRQHSFLSH